MNQLNYVLSMGQEADWLLDQLRLQLSDKEGLFRKIVVVPSGLMKQHLYKKLLQDKIVTGFKIFELPLAIDYLLRLVSFEDKRHHTFPATLLLSMHLEAILSDMMEAREEVFKPLVAYLSGEPHKRRAKIQDLSNALSQEFTQYGLYGGEALKKWCENKSWQTALWNKVFSSWDYPYKLFTQKLVLNPLQLDMEIHLFGFSYIPPVYEQFLHKLPSSFKLYEYYLSPCAYFWGDICSEKERLFLSRRYAKQAVKQGELKELEGYLEGRNTLLANFGKQTQKRFNTLLDQQYLLREQQEHHEKPLTLLNAMKEDIIEWKEERREIQAGDNSLQVHEVSSKKREIEVLFAQLLDLTYHHEIKPSDILVLAPDISEYFPFIHQVFHDQTPFPIEVHDLEVISQSPFLQSFWEILCLKEKRWEQKDIFKLLMMQPILDRQGWKQEEVKQLKKWCEAAHILWGFDAEHRKEMVSMVGVEENILECSEIGTWKYGFQRLLFGLSSVYEEGMVSDELLAYYPMEEVEMVHAELLGDFMQLVRNLYEDTCFLSTAQLPLSEWVEHFKKLYEKYLLADSKDTSMQHSVDFLTEQLKTLMQLSHKVEDAIYPFSSIKRFFKETLCKKSAVFASSNKEAIRFASLKPQQMISAKVIWLLGMEEGAFPRFFEHSSLREIDEKKMDYIPSCIEEDRQTILDVFLYAQEFVRFSYSSMDPKDGKGKNISFLIEEILDFIQKRYSGSYIIKQIHKHLPFHKEEYQYNHFSERVYRLAQSVYHLEQERPLFIPEFYSNTKSACKILIEKKSQEKILLQELKVFARNPLQYYLNESLGLYIKKQKAEGERVKREFIVSPLDKARFRIDHFNEEFQRAYQKLDVLGALPTGLFKEIAWDQLHEEREDFMQCCKDLNIDPAQMMTLELSASCLEPMQKKENHWLVPHLEIELKCGTTLQIEGILEQVSEQGLGVYGKGSLQDYVKAWPVYLVFHQVVLRDFLGRIQPQLILFKDGTIRRCPSEEVSKHLQDYFVYYKKAQETPSPFFPSWAEALLSQSTDELDKVIKSSFNATTDLQKKFLDEYQKWSFEHLDPFCAHTIERLWGKELCIAFDPLLKWSQKGGKNA